MNHDRSARQLLPLGLCGAPPGLRMVLTQAGVPTRDVEAGDVSTAFVIFDGRNARARRARRLSCPSQTWIDIDPLRQDSHADLFERMIDHKSMLRCWPVPGGRVTERVARFDKGACRRQIVDFLRGRLLQAGGVWLGLSPLPSGYRSAFNFRVDLDERVEADYFAFARLRAPIADCTTHFVSTAAYGASRAVMSDLAQFDTQSHAHFHHIYADERSNRDNLRRAHDCLRAAGMSPVGFAAPGGRWNPGLDTAVEELGYSYASDFQLHFDDWPAHAWRGDRFSRVLQVPIHPVCEGIFLEAGLHGPRVIADYFRRVMRTRFAAGEPAFLYGHPERRLVRFPLILKTISEELQQHSSVWRVTLTEFARFWKHRSQQRWSAWMLPDGRLRLQFETDPAGANLAVVVDWNDATTTIPVRGTDMVVERPQQSVARKQVRFDAASEAVAPHFSLRQWIKNALDWEKVTPPDDLPTHTIAARWKKRLRLRQERARKTLP